MDIRFREFVIRTVKSKLFSASNRLFKSDSSHVIVYTPVDLLAAVSSWIMKQYGKHYRQFE